MMRHTAAPHRGDSDLAWPCREGRASVSCRLPPRHAHRPNASGWVGGITDGLASFPATSELVLAPRSSGCFSLFGCAPDANALSATGEPVALCRGSHRTCLTRRRLGPTDVFTGIPTVGKSVARAAFAGRRRSTDLIFSTGRENNALFPPTEIPSGYCGFGDHSFRTAGFETVISGYSLYRGFAECDTTKGEVSHGDYRRHHRRHHHRPAG